MEEEGVREGGALLVQWSSSESEVVVCTLLGSGVPEVGKKRNQLQVTKKNNSRGSTGQDKCTVREMDKEQVRVHERRQRE